MKNTTHKQPTRLASMAKVRKLRQPMEAIFVLSNSALAYADELYSSRPQSAAIRLGSTFREIAAQLPKEKPCR